MKISIMKATTREVVRQFIIQHPEITQNRTLAKLLYEQYPKLFKTVEDARSSVRHVLGKSGRKSLKDLGVEGNFPETALKVREDEKQKLPNQLKYLLQHNKKSTYSLEELSDMFNCGVGKIKAAIAELNAAGYVINLKQDKAILSKNIEKGEDFILDIKKMSAGFYKFGAIGDNHLGSRYQRLDVLNALYDQFEREGVKVVFNTGNWIDGEARFNTHDLLVHGMDNQIRYFLENYPQRKGIVTKFITGDDHEGWYTQREGIDVGKHMANLAKEEGREDLIYLGHMEHDVIIKAPQGETRIRVLHPGGGSSYAVSYAAQKIVESYTGGEKPDILLLGHYHKAAYDYIRGVHAIQTGCFTGNTSIVTSEGSKKIRNIKVGDQVLTHNNRLRKVIRLNDVRYADDFWRLNYGRKGRFDQTLTATSEHPVLMERNGIRIWCPIKDIQKDDTIFVKAAVCKSCGDKIPFWLNMCSSCNPMDSKITRDRLSEARGGFKKFRTGHGSGHTHLEKDIIPFCQKMKDEGWIIIPVGNGISPDAIGVKDGKVVAFEIESRRGNHLDYKKTKYDGATINDFIDEVRWVDCGKERVKQPRPYYEYDEETGCVKVKVISCGKVEKVDAKRKREKVYNFEVEEDNSYIAGNVVVHNCTEDQTPFMRKKKLAAHLGGWIFEFATDEVGAITRFKQEFFPFYDGAYYTKWQYLWK